MQPIRWGIIGTGRIAKDFAMALATLQDARLVAVGSRSTAAAESFGAQFGVPRRYNNYEALAVDSEVEAVYVAVPHSFHAENTLLCLAAGKPVLCEKPFALSARQAEQVIHMARSKRLLVMEGMWTRCFPLIARLRQWLADGAIGAVRLLSADFSFRANFAPEARLFNPALGGGALLDVGIYPVSFASMVLGPPTQIRSAAHIGATGVDYQSAMIFRYENGAVATLYCGLLADTSADLEILGETGTIKIHSPFWKPSRMTLTRPHGESEEVHLPYPGNGMQFEAAEFMSCLRQGRLESALMPLSETLAILRTIDTLRLQWGLHYPGE